METISEGMGRLALSEDEKWINEGEEIEEEDKKVQNNNKEKGGEEQKADERVNDGEELEVDDDDNEKQNEEDKGEEQKADEKMENEGEKLEEEEEDDDEKQNEEKGGEEQKTDEMVNEGDEALEEEDDDKQNNEEKGGEEQKADEMVNEGEEIEEEEDDDDDDGEKQKYEENGEEQQADDEMVNKSKELEEEEDEEEKGEEIVNKVGGMVLGKDEKWIKQYSTSQKILLVGEGDFSFSAALATAFGDASNMVATSLNSHGFLAENYKNALSNVDMLRNRRCTVMHGVDVRIMAYHPLLHGLTFDRIVFNFPFARLSKKSPSPSLQCQQGLVRAFLDNAVQMIGEDGEIHITHKTNESHIDWDITGLAYEQGLELAKEADFRLEDYPGYNTKYGFGGDANFHCYPSMTYMFRLSDDAWEGID